MRQVNGSAGSRAPSATEMDPEDRTSNFGDALTGSDQGLHFRNKYMKEYYKDWVGHRNTSNSH